jgi:hypothetical protein
MKTQAEWNREFTRKMEASWSEVFVGMAIPCNQSTVDGGTVRTEKVLKFNRKAMQEANERDWKAEDKAKRDQAYSRLLAFYQNEENVLNERSPFDEE